jgi:hypothetical protein
MLRRLVINNGLLRVDPGNYIEHYWLTTQYSPVYYSKGVKDTRARVLPKWITWL